MVHAGDSLYVGTGAGLFILDIRDPSRVARVLIGPELPSNSVRALAARSDSVFVGTDAGWALRRGAETRVFPGRDPFARGAATDRVQAVGLGAGGEVFLATRGRGVGVLKGKTVHAITRRDSLLDNDVFDVLDRYGRPRLFATAAGLCAQVGDTTFVSFQAGAGIPRGEVRQVVGDGQNAYLRVARRGVYRFDGMRATPVEAPAEFPLADAASIALGADGTLWACGAGWVAMRRAGKWSRAPIGPADAAVRWRVVVADGAGAFVGSADGLVLAVGRGTTLRVRLGDGLPAPRVVSIRPDGRGGAWFVNGGRVVHADARSARVSVENTPLDAEAVEISPAGTVLAAGRWTVSQRAEGTWVDLAPSVVEMDPSFTAIAADPDGGLWVGARSGALYRFDRGVWLRYARSRGDGPAVLDARAYHDGSWALIARMPAEERGGVWNAFAGWDSSAAVVDVAASPKGEWVAATRRGLLRYDAQRRAWGVVGAGELVDARAASPAWAEGQRITAIAFDATGRLFVGTEAGIGWAEKTRGGWLSSRDGVGGAVVADLAADASGLWVGFASDGFSVIPLDKLR